MLQGDVVVLRAVERQDLPALHAAWNDLAVQSRRSPQPPAPVPLAAFEARYDRGLLEPDGTTAFVVEVGGQVVGDCLLHTVDRLARTCHLGIGLAREHWGKGYGSDAVRTLVAFAFTHLDLRKVSLDVLADDARAVGAYRRAGFVEEGRFVDEVWFDGAHRDLLRMAARRP